MGQGNGRTARGGLRAGVAVVLAVLVASMTVGVAGAHQKGESKVKVSRAWARTSPMEATNGAVYMVLENTATKDNTLVGASVPETVAMETQIHETTMGTGGTMQMAEVEEITLAGKSTTKLEPGGYHVMLMGLAAPLEVGAKIKVTLEFEHGEAQTVKAVVKQ